MSAMTPERWQRVESVFDAALDASPEERAALLDARCTGDAELRAEVERLLAACDASGGLPDGPAELFAAPLVALDGTADGAPRATADVAPPARPRRERVGPYRLVREAGEGGMGTVYVAERDDGQYRKRVALKLVRPGLHFDDRFVRRFVEERQILARLEHPNVARLLDGGVTEEGLPYYVMELVDGEPIDHYCDARCLDVNARLALFCKVCGAVEYAHERGVVHRDLKPSNILVTADGEPKLLDFGIAKLLRSAVALATGAPGPTLTRTGQRLLTPAYASPEQVRGEEVTAASDVYALGVILFELLTGRRPYRVAARTVREVEHAILEVDPSRPSTAVTRDPKRAVADVGREGPPMQTVCEARRTTPEKLRHRLRGDLDAIVLTALRKEAARRYPSPSALAADIRRHLGGHPVTARGEGLAYRARKLVRRHRVSVAAAAAGMAAGVAAIVAAGSSGAVRLGGAAAPRLVPGSGRRVAISGALELDPAPSPDGRRVAYASDSGGAMRLYVKEIGRETAQPLTAALPGYQRAPRWSPDGTRLAFQAEGSLWVVPAAGGEPRVLVRPGPGARQVGSLAWSPDGREIAYVEDRAIRARAVDGGLARTIVTLADEPHSLAWSADGEWIAYVDRNATFVFGYWAWGTTVNLGNAAPSAVWVVRAREDAGGRSGRRAPVRVTDDQTLNTSPVWVPTERALLFVSNRGGDRDVYRVPLGADGHPAGEPERVTTGLGAHTIGLARDGRSLAYSVFRNISNVWAVPIPARGAAAWEAARQVTTGSQSIEGFSLSPDGRWLAFDSDRAGNQDVYKMPTAGGEAVRLTDTPTDEFMPDWSPDGRELAFYAFRGGAQRLAVVRAEGGPARAVAGAPAIQRLPDWSPDGRSLVFNTDRPERFDLWVISRDAVGTWGAARRLTRDGAWGGRWSPDGRSILYGRPDGLWTMDAAGGGRRHLVAIDSTEVATIGGATWSRDGTTIYFKQFDATGRPSIGAVPAAGGAPRVVFRFAEGRQSPRPELATDGARLYFTVAERASDVWLMTLGATPR